jgi:Secretion system C-terminal sorting domain
MKTNLLLRNLTPLLTLLALLFSTLVFAQPANDDCANAFAVTIGADEDTCVPVEGSTVGGTPSTLPANVCSGSWFGDDIWFSFTTGSIIPDDGYTIKALYGTEAGDLGQAGMALYESCDVDEDPLVCFSDAPGRITIEYDCEFLTDHTYYVRIWSAPGVNDNSGSLRLCVFNADPPPPPVDTDVVLWGSNPGEGDFDGGLNDWTTIDDAPLCSDTFNLWRWSPNAASTGNSCGNALSTSPSHCNGAMVFNSDAYDSGGGPCGTPNGECQAPQTGELISPTIDISNFNVAGISVKFFQTTRQFQSAYFISYSNDDGSTWIDVEINDELAVNSGTADEYKRVFLPGADLNSSTFKIKFRYEANYYYWIVDDVQIIETERNNLVVMENFYAIAPNAVTPASQVEPFSFLADVFNAGAATQTGVNLNVTIDDNSGQVFSGDLPYDPIPPDSLVENIPFVDYFTPDGSINNYNGTYEITSDSIDFDSTDNFQFFSFETSDTVFAKERGMTRTILPAAGNWEGEGEPHSWAYGNYFYVVDGDDWWASSATFGLGNADAPGIAGRLITIYLYKWDTDTNEDGNLDADERTRVGFFVYEITGNELTTELITVPLINFPSGDPGPVDLESGQAYVLMVEYSVNDEVDLALVASDVLDYGAMVFRSELDGIPEGNGRYSGLLGINGDLESEPYSSVGFGRNLVPVVRLNISTPVSTEETLDAYNIIEISPNPADSKINLNIELTETQERVNIRILDVNGRLLMDQPYENMKNESLEFDVSNYASGAYFLHFITNNGVRTERFIVQH